MAEQDVGGIALGLSLDTTGWSSGIAKAKSELEGLKRAAGNIQIGVTSNVAGGAVGGGSRVVSRGPAAVAGGPVNIGEVNATVSPRFTVSAGAVRQLRTQINQQMRELAATGQAVQVSVTLGRIPYATMRSEIARGIGEVPIRVKPDAGSLTAFAAVLSAMTGQTPGRSRAAIEQAAASRGIPARAMGGPTQAGRAYLVGEKGPEIRYERSPGYIQPIPAKAGSIAERLTKKESDFLGNLRQASQDLRPEHVKFGREWYSNARQWVRTMAASHGIPEDTARGVVAALSAGTQWGANKTKARRVFEAYAKEQPFPYSPALNAHVEAEAILYGRKGPVPSGPKVSQFYRNLAGDFSALTLDRWALRTATRGKLSQIGKSPVREKIAAAYMQAAAEMGMDPAEYQAAVWGLEKERAGARAGGGKDLSAYMARGGRVGGYCFTCGTPVRNQITHQSTAKHQANLRGRTSSKWLSRQPGWAWGYRNLDEQYADPEGYEESDEWKKAFGRRLGGRAAPFGPGESLPPALGTLPVREGYVRGFHSTKSNQWGTAKENLDAIRAHGLKVRRGLGHTYGEPDMVWFSGGDTKSYGDYEDKYSVEAHLPARWFETGGRSGRWSDPPVIGGPSSNMAVGRDISRRRIATYNEPWMRHYRYMLDEVDKEGKSPGAVMRQFGSTLRHLRELGGEYEPSTQGWDQFVAEMWRRRHRYRGGPALRDVFPGGVDLKRFPRPYRLAIGKRLYGLGQQYPYTASKLEGIKAVPGDYLLRHAERIWPGSTAGATPDEIGGLENDPNRIFSSIRAAQPYILLNAGMTDQGAVDMGGLSKSMADAATHEFGHAVDDVHRAVAKRNMRGQMARAGMPSAYAPTSPSEHWAELFLERHKTGMHGDLFGPFEEGDKELYRQTRGRWRGGRAEAYRQTLLHQGGTFSMTGKPPTGRYAVATTAQKRVTDEDDPLGFLRNFREVAADSPYVGTWLHEGQIYVDPVTVRRHKRDAMKLARANEQLAIFDLKRMREIPTRAWGGPADEPRPYFDRELEEWRERQMDQSAARAAAGRTGWARGEFFGREGQPGIGMWRGRKLDPDSLMAWQAQLRESSRGPGFPTGLGGYGKINPLWLPRKAAGGLADMGKYIVGEIGRELFVPKTREGDIPPDVAAQIPGAGGLLRRILSGKAARGGGVMRDVGGKGSQYWDAPEDGWIIPNRLMGRMGRHRGGSVHPHPHPSASGKRYVDENGQQVSRAVYDQLRAEGRRAMEERAAQAAVAGTPYDPITATGRQELRRQGLPAAIPTEGGPSIAPSLEEPRLRPRAGFDREAALRLELARSGARGEFGGSVGRTVFGALARSRFGGGQERAEAAARARVAQQELTSLLPAGVRGVSPVEVWGQQVEKVRGEMLNVGRAMDAAANGATANAEDHQKLSAQYKALERDSQEYQLNLEKSQRAEQERNENLVRSQKGQSQNLLAVTAAGVAFNTGMQLAQAAFDNIAAAAAPAIDALTGYGATTTRVTKELADALPSAGTIQTLFAQRGVSAGLTGGNVNFLQQALGGSVFAKAGSTVAAQQGDLFRAALGNAPSGLFGGFGGLFGTGLLGEQLGGGQGLFENLARTFSAGTPGQATEGGVVGFIQNALNATNLREDQGTRPRGVSARTPEQAAILEQQQEAINEAIERAAAREELTTGRAPGFAGATLVNVGEAAAAATANNEALDENIRRIAAAGFVFKDATGTIVSSMEDLNKIGGLVAEGFTLPDQQVFARAQAQALTAQRDAARQRGELERETIIPGQLGQQVLANPFISPSAGLQAGFKPTIANLTTIGRLQQDITRDALAGVQAQKTLVEQQLGPDAGVQFQGYMTQVQEYGSQIAALNEQLANRQAQLGALQFAFQLKMINRQLADARGLAGYAGGSELGRLQREQFMLSRESQRLQLESQRLQNEMAQRQINFQVAIAGFQAPGITGQERAARMEEARVEASFAQRQLNINRQQTGIAGQQFGLEGQIFQLQTARAVEELELQRGILIQSHAVEQEQIAAQKQIAALTTRQAQLQAKAQSLFNEATGNFDAQLGAASQYVAQFGGVLAGAMIAVRRAIGVLTGNPTMGRATRGTGPTSAGGAASGLLAFTGGETSITVGEVAGEAVAVLKNPRQLNIGGPPGMSAPGVGGGTVVNVSISGNNISNDMDLEMITRRVTNAVEDALGRKANLLGVNAA